MPDSIRMAETGVIPKVSGSSNEIAAMTPMPGSTPTTLPNSTPTKPPHEVRGLQRDPEAVPQIDQRVTHPQRHRGSCTFRR